MKSHASGELPAQRMQLLPNPALHACGGGEIILLLEARTGENKKFYPSVMRIEINVNQVFII